MKNAVLFFVMIMVLIVSINAGDRPATKVPKSHTGVKVPKEITNLTGTLCYVPSGSFKAGLVYQDSVWIPERIVTVQGFYMSMNEISNLQYRTFYQDILKNQGEDSARKILPDTNCFTKDIPYGNMEVYDKHYFTHAAYDNYPVVGVSWNQAVAYCTWLNEKLEALYKVHPDWIEKYGMNQIRIPTEMEWEYAAKGNMTSEDRSPLYAWGNSLVTGDSKNKWPENFGRIIDESGLVIKDYLEDGAFFTSAANTFQPNAFGLHHMSGNVSEWVGDTYRDVTATGHDFGQNSDVDSVKAAKRRSYYSLLYEPVSKTNARVVKGGNFLDGPVWCLTGNRRAILPEEKHSYIGFRIVSTFYYNPGK